MSTSSMIGKPLLRSEVIDNHLSSHLSTPLTHPMSPIQYSSYRTTLCIEHPPSVIALGALFLAALQLGIRPANPNPKSTVEHTWFALLGTDIEFEVLQSESVYHLHIFFHPV